MRNGPDQKVLVVIKEKWGSRWGNASRRAARRDGVALPHLVMGSDAAGAVVEVQQEEQKPKLSLCPHVPFLHSHPHPQSVAAQMVLTTYTTLFWWRLRGVGS